MRHKSLALLLVAACLPLVARAVAGPRGADVHVQRVTNRLGWIVSDDPLDSEEKLTALLPEKYWSPTNLVFVNHGQQVCQPVIPQCSRCAIYKYCARVNVMKNR